MGLSEKYAQLDGLGEEWCSLQGEGNEAARAAVQERVFILAYQLFAKQADALGKFFLGDWQHFDAQKGSLSKFIRYRLDRRMMDMENEDQQRMPADVYDEMQDRVVRKEVPLESVNRPIGEEGQTLEDILEEDSAPMEDSYVVDDAICELIVLVLNLQHQLSGRANNPTRIQYFRMFFTANVTGYLLEEGVPGVLARREQDVLHALDLHFLDYVMAELCRSLIAIAMSRLKHYGELVDGRPMEEETPLPIPLDVYQTYSLRHDGKKVGVSAISMQWKAYRLFLRSRILDG